MVEKRLTQKELERLSEEDRDDLYALELSIWLLKKHIREIEDKVRLKNEEKSW